MQAACPASCPAWSTLGESPRVTPAVTTTRREGYLEARHAVLDLPDLPDDLAPSGWCLPCCRAAVAPDAPVCTPATTMTTVTPCTPPPGAVAPVPHAPQDGDRAFLDFHAASGCGKCGPCGRDGPCGPCCECVPRWPCGACVAQAPRAARLDSLREVEGRCCAVLVIVTFMGMVVGLALFSDPLLLEMSVRLQRARCATLNYTIVMGASNCTWASCRESCTSPAYKCPQIFVSYTLGTQAGAEDNSSAATASPASPGGEPDEGPVPLLVNVAGCGLDAVRYSCTAFYNDYMGPGHEYECDVADGALGLGAWRRVAVPVAVRQRTATGLSAWMGGLVPLVLCVACVLYIRARRLFTVEPVVTAGGSKRTSLRPRGPVSSAPRSFYKRKMLEMDEWRRRRRQLLLGGAGRGSTVSRVHAPGDSDELVSGQDEQDEQDDEGDLEDVASGRTCSEDDDDVVVEPRPPLTRPESPETPPPPWHRPAPPPPPCSPETSPPLTPDLVPLIVVECAPEDQLQGRQHLRAIPEEPRGRGGGWATSGSGGTGSAPAGQGRQGRIQTVSATVHAHQHYDISQ